ncbi:hypothetical protein Clacol_010455 [Clathrus columnatus]|uniref:Jacalin-type lectin domain-containing protein n=1 Tax=Clathrus columnatus TaxID=1419009 RepID=A0AAV5ATW0_9AGAM|nr:hypothetical protein Clacol_010455 [Clathrus columnatus]
MVLPHEIYIDQLAFPLGGCPIWGSLHPHDDPVDIADVGYISDHGGWIKLFNLRTETDPKKLPSNHRPGSVVITDQDIEKDIFKGPRYSNSIRKLGGSIEVQGKAEAGLSYECAEEKGAILFIAEDAVTRNSLNKIQFANLIQENIENWMEFAKQKGRDIRITDLVLVTGYVRTTTWVAAVFRQKSQWCKFKVGGVLPVGGVKLELWGSLDVNAFAWTGGPEEMKTGSVLDTTHFLKHMAPNISPPALLCKDDPRHQCVLVRGYRMAGRGWRELLPFQKNKLLKGIEVLKRNSHNLVGIIEEDDHTAILSDAPHPANPANTTDPTSRGISSNRRGRGTRRTRNRGSNNPDRGNYNNNRRRDGGAGAGSSSGAGSGAGYQSGSGGAVNWRGRSSGTGETSQQKRRTSGNVKDAIGELDPNEPEHLSGSSWVTDYEGSSGSEESEPSGSECSGDSVTEEKAEYAIIHDDDFSVLPTDVKSASELRTQLQVLKPRVYLNGSVGMLKPTALEFFRSTGYFCQTDPEGLMAYFPKLISSAPTSHFGSGSFYTFSDYQETPEILFATLKKIYIHAQTYIHSIQCEYQGPEQNILLGNKHGSSGESPLYVFELNSDEYIVKIRGRSGEYIEQLQFLTNKGRVSSIYGGSGGKPFVWTVDEKRYPDSPGLHHFEGTCENYLRTLKACFPIYPWFEEGTQPTVSVSQTTNNSPIKVEPNVGTTTFTIDEVCDILMVFSKDETGNVQHIRIDAVLKLLRETEGQSHIRRQFGKVLKMFNSSQSFAVHCASMIIAELARLGKLLPNFTTAPSNTNLLGGFESEIKNILLGSVHQLLEDKERYTLLQKLSKQELLTNLSEQAQFQPSIIAVLPNIIRFLRHNSSYLQASAATAIRKLVEQEEYQNEIVKNLPNFVNIVKNLVDNENTFIKESGILFLAELADHAPFRSELLRLLLPGVLTSSKPHNQPIWVNVLAASSTLLDQLNHDENFDYYVSQLIGMLEDDNEDLQDTSTNVIVKLLRYVKNPSLVFRLIDLTTKSDICKFNGMNLLLTIFEELTYKNAIFTVIRQTIPDLVEMLYLYDWKRVATLIQQLAQRSEFRQEIMEIVPRKIILLQQSTHSPDVRLAGIELLTVLSEYTEARQVIANNLEFLLTFLNDWEKSVVYAGLSLFEVLSTDGTLVTLMAPLIIPLVKGMFMREEPKMDHKGIEILFNISKQEEHNYAVTNMIKEVALDIANSLTRNERFFSHFPPAEHTLKPKSSFLGGLRSVKYVNGTELLKLFSEKVEFQSPILEVMPLFVEATKFPNHASVYDILKIFSVHGALQSAIEPVIPFIVGEIESKSRYLEKCLDLLWTLSEQAAYQPAVMLYVPRLALLVKENSSTSDIRVTMAGVLMNLWQTLSSNTCIVSGSVQGNIDHFA